MKRTWTCLAAAALALAVSGCGDDRGAVKARKEIQPQNLGGPEQPPQPQPVSYRTDAPLPPQAQGLKDAVASLPPDPATAKLKLDQIFDRTRPGQGTPNPLGYAPTQVSAPSQADIDAKRRAVTAAYPRSPIGRSDDRDQPRAGTIPAVPLPDANDAAGDANVRGGGAAIVAFDAYLRDALHEPGKVFSRAFWGAKASRAYEGHQNPTRVTIHHTDSARQTMTVEDTRRVVKGIQEFHQGPERGWGDIGYHFLVDGGGNVFEGRHADVIGAHVWQHNMNNLGIANIGDYNRDQLTDAQKITLTRLISFLALKYNVDPRQTGFIHGHHDFTHNNTDCPGRNLDQFIQKDLRRMVEDEAKALLAKNGKNFVPLLVTHGPSA